MVESTSGGGRSQWWWALAAIPLVVVAWIVLIGSDARLNMAYEGPAEPVRPGESATIRSPDGDCIGSFPRVFEPYVFGMWRQTHPERSPWWAPGGSGEAFSTLDCAIGQRTVDVPHDVTADRIALCDINSHCVEVRIDHSG
jgi:hypothetical protein